MGKYHIPSGRVKCVPNGYDSCFAKGGESNVINNEMIVYRTAQACPIRLIECTPHGK